MVFPFLQIFPQPFNREITSIPFSDSNGIISNTFSGGINNPEFFFIDIDNDDDYDIIFMDSDGTSGWYKNNGSKFNPLFEFTTDIIPGAHFNGWFYLVDIDNDGDADLFTGGATNYIDFYRNTGNVSSPFYELEIDTLKDNDDEFMFSEFGCNPLFADVDNDNDYDFITGTSAGKLTYYENVGSPTNFIFEFITDFWQNILIISTDGNDNLHGASSLDFADIDDDGDLDLFWGDFFSPSVYFLHNTGTPETPNLQVELYRYPPNADSVFTSGFNMPRFVDIDADDDLDMFVSVLYDPTVPQSLIFYENAGTVTNPLFIRLTNNFLKTLDTGNQSVPVFYDIDDDGDKDLFIGTANNPDGSIYYFVNNGSVSAPEYLLVDSAYFGITGELSLAPTFGDIDDDGDADLVVGNFDGTLSLFRNTGSAASAQFVFESLIQNNSGINIDAGVYARPVLIDFDLDGDLDLVLGRFNGQINYYRNVGSQSNYSFELVSDFFGGIDVGDNSTPFIADYDNDNDFDLFTGDRSGQIIHYRNDGSNSAPNWSLVTNEFIVQNFGSETAPVLCDIDNDTDPDLFVGNVKGGLYFYRNSLVSDINDDPQNPVDFEITISSFPNPFNDQTNIDVIIPKAGYTIINVYNLLGEKILTLNQSYLSKGKQSYKWSGRDWLGKELASGGYIVVVSNSGKIRSHKLLLLK